MTHMTALLIRIHAVLGDHEREVFAREGPELHYYVL